MYTLMHSYIVSDPYCVCCTMARFFFLLGMLVVGLLDQLAAPRCTVVGCGSSVFPCINLLFTAFCSILV